MSTLPVPLAAACRRTNIDTGCFAVSFAMYKHIMDTKLPYGRSSQSDNIAISMN